MIVELKHHYGWERYEVKTRSLKKAAYEAVRRSHTFLADDNHTFEVKTKIPLKWGGKVSKFNAVYIYRNEKSEKENPYSGPGWAWTDYWFAVTFRTAAEAASNSDS